MYVNNHADRAAECVAISVRELCDMRDLDDTQVFSGSELKFMIDMLKESTTAPGIPKTVINLFEIFLTR